MESNGQPGIMVAHSVSLAMLLFVEICFETNPHLLFYHERWETMCSDTFLSGCEFK